MGGRAARLVANALRWRGLGTGTASIAAMAAAAALAATRLSPLGVVYGNNRAAAWGVVAAAVAAEGYVLVRLGRYGLRRVSAGRAPGVPGWPAALVDTGRYLGLTALVAVLVLAPVLGRAGQPLWALGYGEPVAWFAVGAAAVVALLVLIWPAWGRRDGRPRVLPHVPPRPDLEPRPSSRAPTGRRP